ncbi:MAG: hypothetical protein M3Q97_04405 [Bacteroidota bacterium]|nr:hypothetical protein [Bacteroidota bacterium]
MIKGIITKDQAAVFISALLLLCLVINISASAFAGAFSSDNAGEPGIVQADQYAQAPDTNPCPAEESEENVPAKESKEEVLQDPYLCEADVLAPLSGFMKFRYTQKDDIITDPFFSVCAPPPQAVPAI